MTLRLTAMMPNEISGEGWNHLLPPLSPLERRQLQMEAEADSGDIYESLKRSKKSEGVINPGDKVERYAFATSLFKYDEKSYNALKQLISEDGGVLKPVLAVKTKGTILIIDGWHRVLASRELNIPCPAVFCEGLTASQMENAALSLNLSGRKMRPKERREIAIALYEQFGWG
jgi:ParB-like chromosome segregation protein Spo0J